jgi:hypothetical protein
MKYMVKNEAPGMDKFSEVTQHIFISNWKNGCDTTMLREQGIKAVLYLGVDAKHASVTKAYEKRHINHLHLPVDMEPPANILPHVQMLNSFIHDHVRKEEKVLIHCNDGISISPAILAIYFISRYYVTNFITNMKITKNLVHPEEMFAPTVIKFIKQYRPCILIHPAFTYQVLLAEMLMKHQFSKEFREYRRAENVKAKKEREIAKARKRRAKSNTKAAGRQKGVIKQKKKAKDAKNAKKAKDDESVESTVSEEDVLSSEEMEDYISSALKKKKTPPAKAKGKAKGNAKTTPKRSIYAPTDDEGYDVLSDLHGIRPVSRKREEPAEPEESADSETHLR